METHKTVQESVEMGRRAPGEERILAELKKAQEAVETADGLKHKELLDRTGLARSILSQYLYDLQKIGLIERTLERKYRIKEAGNDVLRKRDDVLIILGSKKVLQKEIEPSQHVDAPLVLPVDAAIYVSPEIEQLIEEAADELEGTARRYGTKPPVSKEEAIRSVLAEITEPIAAHLDTMFLRRFLKLDEDRRAYQIQQMSPLARRKYFLDHYRIMPAGKDPNAQRKMKETLNDLERQYMDQKFPEGGPPPLTFETVLDFEAAVVVKVSRERLKKDATAIRNRFALYLLSLAIPGGLQDTVKMRLLPRGLSAMAEAGIITDEEFQQFRNAKNEKQRMKVIHDMGRKYYGLAWGIEYEAPLIITRRLRTSRRHKKRVRG